jgi:tripartite-type tricarboxylate transporter receptor subunit TctC
MVHVPYKGIGPALNDLLGGQVSMMFSQLSSALPHIRSGKLRALGMASLKRSAVMPELPTIAEQGFPGFEAVSWYALMVPAGTPSDIISRLHAETTRIVRLPDVREKLAGLGAEPVGNSPQELAATIRSESARWADVIQRQGIKSD